MAVTNLLGLDVGERKIGVARVNTVARLPQPLKVLPNNTAFLGELKQIIAQYEIDGLVVGLPRNLQGQETAQSRSVREFCQTNLTGLNLPIIMQDETLSSVTAQARQKPADAGVKGDDALAAAVILEDYLKVGNA